jgi:phage anti-repressor protein
MQELIKINKELIGTETVNSVNARELYDTLELTKEFSTWIKVQIKSLGLEEDVDYITFTHKVKAGRGTANRAEYILTTDTAKHISMASRTAKGKEVRTYFIAIEKEFIKDLQKAKLHIANGYKSQLAQRNSKIKELEGRVKVVESQSDVFMNDPSLHNDFLEFLYQANKITNEISIIRHVSKNLDETQQSMSNFMAFITRRYEKIRGVSKYEMPNKKTIANNKGDRNDKSVLRFG